MIPNCPVSISPPFKTAAHLTGLSAAIKFQLEILDSILCNRLSSNHQLLYTLLGKQLLFEHLRQGGHFVGDLSNVLQVLGMLSLELS